MGLLSVNNITMNYHSINGEVNALKDISFEVNNGEFLSILGPSGCGKTTLLNIISGILNPSDGTVLFKGELINKNLSRLGYMFQKFNTPIFYSCNNIFLKNKCWALMGWCYYG